jgi:hypothetical protein
VTALLGLATVATAAPAAADTPEMWPDVPAISIFEALLLFGGVPLLVFVVIAVCVYAPSLMRGEGLGAGGQTPEDQWIGGPRKSPEELEAPDGADSKAGGAGSSW